MEITDLAFKLAPFIRECYKQINGIQQIDQDVNQLEANNDQVLKIPLSIYYSVIYYIYFKKDATNTNKLDKVFTRYTPLQANTRAPRYNAIIVREYKQANNSLYSNKVGRLYLLLTIQNTRRLDSEGKYLKYTNILVKTL